MSSDAKEHIRDSLYGKLVSDVKELKPGKAETVPNKPYGFCGR